MTRAHTFAFPDCVEIMNHTALVFEVQHENDVVIGAVMCGVSWTVFQLDREVDSNNRPKNSDNIEYLEKQKSICR